MQPAGGGLGGAPPPPGAAPPRNPPAPPRKPLTGRVDGRLEEPPVRCEELVCGTVNVTPNLDPRLAIANPRGLLFAVGQVRRVSHRGVVASDSHPAKRLERVGYGLRDGVRAPES